MKLKYILIIKEDYLYLKEKVLFKMLHRLSSSIRIVNYPVRCKFTADYTKVPILVESELKEQHVRGSGPGGQAVNKTANCVVLKHLPTGLTIKCHETRSLDENRKKARQILITKLDNLFNGTDSVEAQRKMYEDQKSTQRKRKKERLSLLKAEWKKRENLE